MAERLYRSRDERIIGGVAGGMARNLDHRGRHWTRRPFGRLKHRRIFGSATGDQ